jgi:hypothetical protein
MSGFTRNNELALNRAKTQLMISGAKEMDVSNVIIVVNGAEIRPGNTLELLGVSFDRKFTLKPYLLKLMKEARFGAGRVVWLAQHLPQGQLLQQLERGLLKGKVAHCLTVVAAQRLPGLTKQIPDTLDSLQDAVNYLARSFVGCKRDNHITLRSLLDSARYLSINQLVVKSTPMAAWSAFMSSDGEDGTRNPVGRLLFNSNCVDTAARPTRAMAGGEVRVQTQVKNTFVTHSLEIWNSGAKLRGSFFLSFFIQSGIQKIILNKRYKISSHIFIPQVLALRQLAWASCLFLGVALSCYM